MTATRRRLARFDPPDPPVPGRCTCRGGPTLIGHFRRERLVAVVRRHWARDRCPLPPEHLDVDEWEAR